MSLCGIDSPLYQYLHEVLGLRWAPVSATKSTRPEKELGPCVIFCSLEIGTMETQLIERMMSAIGVSEYSISTQLTGGKGVGLLLDEGLAQEAGLRLLGETVTFNGRRLLRSHNVSDLLEGSEAEVQVRKRQAWAHLQALKRFMQEDA